MSKGEWYLETLDSLLEKGCIQSCIQLNDRL